MHTRSLKRRMTRGKVARVSDQGVISPPPAERIPHRQRIDIAIAKSNALSMEERRHRPLVLEEFMFSSVSGTWLWVQQLDFTGYQILRTKTSMDRGMDRRLVDQLLVKMTAAHTWGWNAGETVMTQCAWELFANWLPTSVLGFVWINELGKNCGASPDFHARLRSATGGLLVGKGSRLRANRSKAIPREVFGHPQPWRDPDNPIRHDPICTKFLWNPRFGRATTSGRM